MSDWAQATAAKAELKAQVLTVYDMCLTVGFDRGEACAVARSLVPEDVAFMRTLVDYWVDTERPCTPSP